MTITTQEFVKHIGAEIVAGRIIVGEMAERRIIGDLGHTLSLTEEGQALLADAEAAIAKKLARKKESADGTQDGTPPAA